MKAFERAAPLVPMATGASSPHAQMAQMALENKDQPRAIAELTALVAVDFNNVEAARQLVGLLRDAGIDDPAKLGPVYRAHRRDRSVRRRRAHRAWPAARWGATIPRARRGSSARCSRSEPVDQAAAHTDLAESYFKSGKRAEAKQEDARRARDRAELRARPEPAAELAGGHEPRQ